MTLLRISNQPQCATNQQLHCIQDWRALRLPPHSEQARASQQSSDSCCSTLRSINCTMPPGSCWQNIVQGSAVQTTFATESIMHTRDATSASNTGCKNLQLHTEHTSKQRQLHRSLQIMPDRALPNRRPILKPWQPPGARTLPPT